MPHRGHVGIVVLVGMLYLNLFRLFDHQIYPQWIGLRENTAYEDFDR